MSESALKPEERLSYLRVLIAIAHADGVLDAEEARQIEACARQLGLSADELTEVRRDLADGLDVTRAMAGVRFSVPTRCRLLRDAYTLAWSDELVTPEELRSLRALVDALDLSDHAPRIQAWVERHIAQQSDWRDITDDVARDPRTG